jgi:hypothetical protein
VSTFQISGIGSIFGHPGFYTIPDISMPGRVRNLLVSMRRANSLSSTACEKQRLGSYAAWRPVVPTEHPAKTVAWGVVRSKQGMPRCVKIRIPIKFKVQFIVEPVTKLTRLMNGSPIDLRSEPENEPAA